MNKIILEHLIFIFILFIIATLVSLGLDDDEDNEDDMKILRIVEVWLMLTGVVYFAFLMVYLIINMGGYLTI